MTCNARKHLYFVFWNKVLIKVCLERPKKSKFSNFWHTLNDPDYTTFNADKIVKYSRIGRVYKESKVIYERKIND